MTSLTGLFEDWWSETLTDPWPVVVPLLGTVLVALLYWRGARYAVKRGIGPPLQPLQIVAFASGLCVAFAAVASPLDNLADASLAWHMVQHEALVLVAAPLLVYSAPLWPLWRALPLDWRRSSLRWLLRPRPARKLVIRGGRALGHPIVAWSVFIGAFWAWHVPALYDLALENENIHAVEHLTFLATAFVFWAQIIPSFPLQPKLSHLWRAGYLFAGGISLHLLSVLIAMAAQPIYPFYGVGSAALADQTAAGAIMDVAGQIVFTTTILVCLWLWLRDDERALAAQQTGERAEARIRPSGALLLAETEFDTSASSNEPEG